MKKLLRSFAVCILTFNLQLLTLNCFAQYTKLLDFSGAANGSHPHGSLIYDGTFLYGMTSNGGTNNIGTIFRIKTDGTGDTVLLNFTGAANGSTPQGALFYDGTFLYGMAGKGGINGVGVLFKIKPDGTSYSKLLDFAGITNGSYPEGSLISDGTFLYGMAGNGGTSNAYGVVFKIKKDGTGDTVLLNFAGAANGKIPFGSLFSDGTFLYGMTFQGGTNNLGVIFKIKPDGTGDTVLVNFAASPSKHSPYGSLISDGSFLYGMTIAGGTNGYGTIFRLKPDGTGDTTLLNFAGAANGKYPQGDLFFDGTFFYGMTRQGGTIDSGVVFKIKPDGTGYVKLLDFTGANGKYPSGNLFSDGTSLYGMTYIGGTNNLGTIFKYQYCSVITDSLAIMSPACGNNNGSAAVTPSGGAGAYTYLWSNGNTTSVVTGLTGQPADTLIVKITDSIGCSHIDIAIVSCVTGISQITDPTTQIFVSPNPTSGNFNLVIGNEIKQPYTIEIYNVLGENIFLSTQQNNNSTIDISSQPGGVYFLNVKTEKKSFAQKLIIQK